MTTKFTELDGVDISSISNDEIRQLREKLNYDKSLLVKLDNEKRKQREIDDVREFAELYQLHGIDVFNSVKLSNQLIKILEFRDKYSEIRIIADAQHIFDKHQELSDQLQESINNLIDFYDNMPKYEHDELNTLIASCFKYELNDIKSGNIQNVTNPDFIKLIRSINVNKKKSKKTVNVDNSSELKNFITKYFK